MNLMDLFIRIGVDDQASKKISKITGAVGKGLAAAAKIGAAAVGVAAAGIAALTKASIDQYAEYEQLVGGAELMFGEAAESVKRNAQDAYKTVQMSQNEYLRQVNGFATGLKTALDGNEQAAADLAHRIIQAEADVVAATGNTQEAVQNAFNGIMRSNFTMIDNLQLGIAPTKEGFQELIDKVNDWNKVNGKATDYQMGNLADMQSALVDYIDMVGMSGYAQAEAAKTIQGSVASMRSAWKNLVTGMADDTADIDGLITRLVESVSTAAQNIVPRISVALNGAAKFIRDIIPVLVEEIPKLIQENLPVLADAAVNLIKGLISGVSNNRKMLVDTIFDVVMFLSKSLLDMLPGIVQLGLDLVIALAQGISENLPELIPAVIDTILKIVEILTDPDNLIVLVDAAIELVLAISAGIIKAIPQLADGVLQLVGGIVDSLFKTDWVQVGKDIISKIWDGWKEGWGSLVEWFQDGVSRLFGLGGESSPAPSGQKAKSHALGLDYVPYDEYPALLHRGEAVLTYTEARKWRGDANGVARADRMDELIGLVRELLGAAEDGQTIVLNDREVARTVRKYA